MHLSKCQEKHLLFTEFCYCKVLILETNCHTLFPCVCLPTQDSNLWIWAPARLLIVSSLKRHFFRWYLSSPRSINGCLWTAWVTWVVIPLTYYYASEKGITLSISYRCMRQSCIQAFCLCNWFLKQWGEFFIFLHQISAITAPQNPDSSVIVLWNTGRSNFAGRRPP